MLQFNTDKYIKTGWTVSLVYLKMDNFLPRLIVRVATGRKFWPLFTEIINPTLGLMDPALKSIEASLYSYTHPMIDRFMSELEIMLSDIYKENIFLKKPHNHLT